MVLLALALLAALALAACGGGADPARQGEGKQGRDAGFVAGLRRGGYVIALRHGRTDFSMTDAETLDYADCQKQRNLDADGRTQARAIGRAVRALGVPIGAVLASPYCRTRETARLAFGRATPSADLLSDSGVPRGEDPDSLDDRFRARLRRRPAAGTNTVLVSHNFAIDAATGVDVEEGEAAVFRPHSGGRGFSLVRTVRSEQWTALARRFPAPARAGAGAESASARAAARPIVREYRVPSGSGPHDVAPARDGTVWFTAQASGHLGRLYPRSGRSRMVPLGDGSAPHGVIVGPDGAPWVTDGGLNAIVRVDPRTLRVRRFVLPADRPAVNLNTATFDRAGRLWFTGQAGVYGSVDPRSGRVAVRSAPRGPGPYGISTTRGGQVWYASLAGSHIARIDVRSGRARVVEPPTPGQGARRIWPDSRGRLWVSEYNAGRLGRYDPRTRRWREWRLPGDAPMPYAVYVDGRDTIWLSDFGEDAVLRLIRVPSASPRSACRPTALPCASCSAAPATSGVPSRPPTASSCCAPTSSSPEPARQARPASALGRPFGQPRV